MVKFFEGQCEKKYFLKFLYSYFPEHREPPTKSLVSSLLWLVYLFPHQFLEQIQEKKKKKIIVKAHSVAI